MVGSHNTLRELCRNKVVREALATEDGTGIAQFRPILAVLRTHEEERWVEREKAGTANSAMVPQHWALSNLRERLERSERRAGEKVSPRRRREIFRVLVRCLHHREVHLEVMDIISAFCVHQLNLGISECLSLIERGEYIKKLQKLVRFHKPLQKLAQLHMPVLSIQELGYIFGEIPDLASRGFRLNKLTRRYSKLQAERLLAEIGSDPALTILRLGNVSGPAPAARFDSVLNRMLFDAWFSGRVQVQGSGEQRRALLHVHTAARVIERSLLGLLEPGTYDLVDRTASVLDVVREIRALLPETEVLFISQHLTLPDAQVALDTRLPSELHDHRPLGEWLHEMATGFAFSR